MDFADDGWLDALPLQSARHSGRPVEGSWMPGTSAQFTFEAGAWMPAAAPETKAGGHAKSQKVKLTPQESQKLRRARKKQWVVALEAEAREKAQELERLLAENSLLHSKSRVLQAVVDDRVEHLSLLQQLNAMSLAPKTSSKPKEKTNVKDAVAAVSTSDSGGMTLFGLVDTHSDAQSLLMPVKGATAIASPTASCASSMQQASDAHCRGQRMHAQRSCSVSYSATAAAHTASRYSSNGSAAASGACDLAAVPCTTNSPVAVAAMRALAPCPIEGARAQLRDALPRLSALLRQEGPDGTLDPSAAAQVEALVGELLGLLRGLEALDPLAYRQLLASNLETGREEAPVAKGPFWRAVAQAMRLSDAQCRDLGTCAEVYASNMAKVVQERRQLLAELQAQAGSRATAFIAAPKLPGQEQDEEEALSDEFLAAVFGTGPALPGVGAGGVLDDLGAFAVPTASSSGQVDGFMDMVSSPSLPLDGPSADLAGPFGRAAADVATGAAAGTAAASGADVAGGAAGAAAAGSDDDELMAWLDDALPDSSLTPSISDSGLEEQLSFDISMPWGAPNAPIGMRACVAFRNSSAKGGRCPTRPKQPKCFSYGGHAGSYMELLPLTERIDRNLMQEYSHTAMCDGAFARLVDRVQLARAFVAAWPFMPSALDILTGVQHMQQQAQRQQQ